MVAIQGEGIEEVSTRGNGLGRGNQGEPERSQEGGGARRGGGEPLPSGQDMGSPLGDLVTGVS